MSFYLSGPPVPTVYGKDSSTPKRNDRDQALLGQIGRLASSPSSEIRPRLASDAGTGEGSIRSGRAGSIASTQTASTTSYTARALQEQQQLMANRIMMSGSSWDSAEDVIVSLKFLQPFVKAGETDSMAIQPDGSRPDTTASGGGYGDFAFAHPNPFGSSDEPPKTASSHTTSVASKQSIRSTSSATLTAMESEVYGILKTYIENKLKKKRGGKEKRLVEVGKKIDVLEDEVSRLRKSYVVAIETNFNHVCQFPDCATYIKLFKRARELNGLLPRESPLPTESAASTYDDDEHTRNAVDHDRNETSASFIDPFDSLTRAAPRHMHRHTTSASSSLSRQVSPARSVSLNAVPRPPARKLSKKGHQSKTSTSSYSSQSSFSPSITADDIFVNFGLNEVDPASTSSTATAGVKAGRRPSMALFTTFGNNHKKRGDDPEEFGWKGRSKGMDEAEISWPLPSPTTGGRMTSDQQQAEMVKAKIAEAFLEGAPGHRERKVSTLGSTASNMVPTRPPRPFMPGTVPGGQEDRHEDKRLAGLTDVHHMDAKDDINVRDSASSKGSSICKTSSRPTSGSSSTVALRKVASASTIRIDQPAIVTDTFEADIFGTSPERASVSIFDLKRDSKRFDVRSVRPANMNTTSSAPPPRMPLPAIPDNDTADKLALARSRSNSASSTQSQAKRQAVFVSDETAFTHIDNDIEELQSSESSSVSDDSIDAGRRPRSAEEIMSALQARTSGIALPGTSAKEPPRPALLPPKHSSWSRASAGRLCDLPEEGEEVEDSSPRSQKRAYHLEDTTASPALSTSGNRYSTDSYDLKITTPEGDMMFQSEYRRDFDVELGTGLTQSHLEQELFFRAPGAKRDIDAIQTSCK